MLPKTFDDKLLIRGSPLRSQMSHAPPFIFQSQNHQMIGGE